MKNKTAIRVLEQIEYYLTTHTNESCEEEHTALALARKALDFQDKVKEACCSLCGFELESYIRGILKEAENEETN